jgi:hypothetical protein
MSVISLSSIDGWVMERYEKLAWLSYGLYCHRNYKSFVGSRIELEVLMKRKYAVYARRVHLQVTWLVSYPFK